MPYAIPDNNLITGASMTNMVPSTAVETTSVSRTGGGRVSVVGPYTGADDSTIDVEVTSQVISGDPQISSPVQRTAGNGTISDIAADPGSNAQSITVTLIDLGIMTRAAFAPFLSVTLRAKDTGPDGNAITITVDRSGLTYTPTEYATTQPLRSGAADLLGPQWNWGGKTLNPDGTVPTDTSRIALGIDPTVYRQYRKHSAVDGQYRYSTSPTITAGGLTEEIPLGTQVYDVTGTYTVTVTDGVTPEVYTGVQTLYDLLTQIQADSDLIEVDGVIANDTRPGGMALDDLNVITRSYVYEQQQTGTSYITEADIEFTPDADAPTETLSVVCDRAAVPGAEVWRVFGDVSQRLSDAVTGILYDDGKIQFTIPPAVPPLLAPTGTKRVSLEAQNAGVSVCSTRFVLGSAARTKTYNFYWRVPEEECPCDASLVAGGPNPDWLGVDPDYQPGEADMSLIPANIQTRREAVTAFERSFIDSQIVVSNGNSGSGQQIPVASVSSQVSEVTTTHLAAIEIASATVKMDVLEIDACKLVCGWLRQSLVDIDSQFPDTFPADAGTEFDTVLSEVIGSGGFGAFAASTGGQFWARIEQWVLNTSGGIDLPANQWPTAQTEALKSFIASNARSYLMSDYARYCEKYKPKITAIYEAAGLESPFGGAGSTGGAIWQDHGGGRFESDEDYLAIFPNHFYHSAVMEDDGTGVQVPTSTMEFGVGISIGCPGDLTPGDKLVIEIEEVDSPGSLYQPGDTVKVLIIRADPVSFGGGQDGDDTLTWSVSGTVDSFADYELVLTSPAAYDDNDLSFLITQGAIPFELGDTFTFALEGGEFRWRQDAGSWTSGVAIAPSVSLADGLSAVFSPGTSPSYATGDAYSFLARATNGPARLETPDGQGARWTGSTTIVSDAGDFDQLLIWHDMDSSCSITLQGSDDDFSSTPLSVALPWRRGVIAYQWAAAQSYAKVRLVITGGDGTIYWAWIGEGFAPAMPRAPLTDPGRLSRTRAARGDGTASMTHSGLSAAGVDTLEDLANTVETSYGGRFGLVYGGDGLVVELAGSLSVDDIHFHQPTDRTARVHNTAQELTVIA